MGIVRSRLSRRLSSADARYRDKRSGALTGAEPWAEATIVLDDREGRAADVAVAPDGGDTDVLVRGLAIEAVGGRFTAVPEQRVAAAPGGLEAALRPPGVGYWGAWRRPSPIGPIAVSISIGVALRPDASGPDPEALLEHALAACTRARQPGGAGIAVA